MIRFTLLVFALGFLLGMVTTFRGGAVIGSQLLHAGAAFVNAAQPVQMHEGVQPALYVEGVEGVIDGRTRGRR